MFKDLNTNQGLRPWRIESVFYCIVIVLIFIGAFKIAEAVFKPLAISIVLGFLVYPVYTFLARFKGLLQCYCFNEAITLLSKSIGIYYERCA